MKPTEKRQKTSSGGKSTDWRLKDPPLGVIIPMENLIVRFCALLKLFIIATALGLAPRDLLAALTATTALVQFFAR